MSAEHKSGEPRHRALPGDRQGSICILGVDPGLADVGWGVIESAGRGKSRMVAYGVIRTPAGLALAQRLEQIFEALGALIEQHRPDVVAVEQLFFSKNVKTAMVVAHGRAACILATARRRIPLFEYTPLQIKQAVTGHGRAGKAQVQMMVRAVLALAEIPRPDHAADALAAALCHAHALAFGARVQTAKSKLADVAALIKNQQGDGPDDPRKLLLSQRRQRRTRRR